MAARAATDWPEAFCHLSSVIYHLFSTIYAWRVRRAEASFGLDY